ncbi:unnamed protein product [Effrenium voratum]|uniref:Uncharacterized protein n=1 Tax=Effrenium voratum TaxID=2562239 RepID=A0AA36J2A1_9DINO|nr:unnamed protein product [Effrenium voratum]
MPEPRPVGEADQAEQANQELLELKALCEAQAERIAELETTCSRQEARIRELEELELQALQGPGESQHCNGANARPAEQVFSSVDSLHRPDPRQSGRGERSPPELSPRLGHLESLSSAARAAGAVPAPSEHLRRAQELAEAAAKTRMLAPCAGALVSPRQAFRQEPSQVPLPTRLAWSVQDRASLLLPSRVIAPPTPASPSPAGSMLVPGRIQAAEWSPGPQGRTLHGGSLHTLPGQQVAATLRLPPRIAPAAPVKSIRVLQPGEVADSSVSLLYHGMAQVKASPRFEVRSFSPGLKAEKDWGDLKAGPGGVGSPPQPQERGVGMLSCTLSASGATC